MTPVAMLLDSGAVDGMNHRIAASALFIAALACATPAAAADNPLPAALRQGGASERAACDGIRRALDAASDAALVVRTSVEIGFNPCQAIRCALEGAGGEARDRLCRKVVFGAVEAGVPADVVARCTAEACAPPLVAALLAESLLEVSYCYLGPRPPSAAVPEQRSEPLIDRSFFQTPPPQISPFDFRSAP